MRGSKRGSKRYSVSKHEDIWIQQQLLDETCDDVIISSRSHVVKGNTQIWLMFIPILEVFITSASLIGSYIIGRLNKVIKPWPYLPYASQTGVGNLPRCVFTLGISLSSFLTLLLVILRYKQVSLFHKGVINKSGLAAGIFAAVSKLVIASFQYNTIPWIDVIATGSYFFFSCIYFSIQVHLTRKTKTISTRALYLTRLILIQIIVVLTVLFSTFIFFKDLSYMNKPPKNVAQILQWLLLACINIYTLTFAVDVKQIIFCFDMWVAPKSTETVYRKQRCIRQVYWSNEYINGDSPLRRSVKSTKSTNEFEIDEDKKLFKTVV